MIFGCNAFTDKPGPPREPTVTDFTENTISMKWEEPEDNGGSEIIGYILERKESTRTSWNNSMTTSEQEYTVRKLVSGKSYFLRVAAENEVGVGPWVELAEPVTAKCPFGKKTEYLIIRISLSTNIISPMAARVS